MFDLQVYEFKQQIITEINNSELPLSVLYYIMKDLEKMTSEALAKQLEMEKAQRAQQNNEDLGLVDIDINKEC